MADKTLHFICEKGKDHFAQPILDKINLNIVKRMGSNDLSHIIHSIGAKNIWVEWASHPAIMVSKIKRPWQKLIIRLHRYEMYRKKWMHRIKWENVDCVVFVNSELEKEFKKTINNSVKTITIPNSLTTDQFEPTIISNSNSMLAYGLQFESRKAYIKLIRMFKKVIDQNSNFNLTIAGQEPAHTIYKKKFEECKKIVDELNLINHVHFELLTIDGNELKTHSNIKKLLKTHNAIISYSENESFHYSFAEGLLCGLNGFCRGWNELSLKEFWGNWNYDSEESMIKGILDWGEMDSKNRKQIAKMNRQYIIDNFSTGVIAQKYEKLFEEISRENSQ